ncbi:hypothetical protein BGZ74_002784 [Mortierella antarctica]|nr:hypothetical protein BGZ74_002784 [Mortierella antarctica]
MILPSNLFMLPMAGRSSTLKRPAVIDVMTTQEIDTDMDSSDSESDNTDFEDGQQATRSDFLSQPTEPQATMLDHDLATAETPEALSELSVLIADHLTLFEAATIAGELPAPPKDYVARQESHQIYGQGKM